MRITTSILLLTAGGALSACSDQAAGKGGIVKIDGSSTVFPVTEAVAEEFQAQSDAKVTIGVSGTGGGMKKFCAGEIDITGASRTIRETEVSLCADGGIEYIELAVAYDGITVVVNKDNDWVDYLTVSELQALWEPAAQNKIKSWNQIRSSFPSTEVTLFGPGADSGTFDYFTKKVVGVEHSSRGDYTGSEDDNILVQGVRGASGSLGYFGFAYYLNNKDSLKVVPIGDSAATAVTPSKATISDLSYTPLSRPIFIYVSKAAADREEVSAFVDFYLSQGGPLAEEVGYIGLPAEQKSTMTKRFADRSTGTK
jgi:phosphate transport system substrate-binding protein